MSSLIQRSFAAGEVAPAIFGRADQVKYQTGLARCRNFFVRRHGGVSNRAGTKYLDVQKSSTVAGRLWKFIFNAEQTYVLWFENQTLRFVQNGAMLTVSGVDAYKTAVSMSGATQANPCVITATAHGFTNGQSVQITGVVGMTQLNGNSYTVANATADTFELSGIDSTAYGAYVSGGTINLNYVVGDLVVSGGINYYCIVASVGNVPPNATYWYPLTGNVYEIPTPYVTEDLPLLKFSQSGDVVTITHPSYDPRDLARFAATRWTLQLEVFEPLISAPATLTVSGAAGTTSKWVATAIKSVTREESVPSPSAGSSTKPTSGAPRTLTIGTVSGAQEYNIYRHDGNGIYGYVGTASGSTFIDDGIVPDYTLTPPLVNTPFSGAGNKPGCSGYYQQRKMYGRTDNNIEDIFGSRTGSFKNMTISSPVQDSDAVRFTLAGKQVNEIRHIVEIGQLVILTSGAEWIREGDATDPLTPSSPNLKVQTYNGSADVTPVVISDNLLYLQARQSIIRDFRFDQQTQGYTGRDLTVFSTHLFDNYRIVAMDYAQIPHSIMPSIRSDGTMNVLTYLREHEIWGWGWFDTDGLFEDVVVVPEGAEDVVYCLVHRTINGQSKRYLESFASRQVTDDAIDAVFMDSTLTYNGWNTTAISMTLSGGTNWTIDETLTLTASMGYFTAGDVGNSIVLRIFTDTYDTEEGWTQTTETLMLTITVYNGPTNVSVETEKTVPVAYRNAAFTDWGKGVDQVAGLSHLEGKTVSILADGHVITNGLDGVLITVSGGQLSVDLDRPYVVIHVGIPYCSDLQTLDLEVVGAETLQDKKLQVNQVTLLVDASRGIWAGNDFEHLYEHKQRDPGDQYGMIEGVTGKVELSMSSAWNKGGRVCIRQRDPLPLTILAAIPSLQIGG